jgi:hypothetical protein
MGIGKNLDERNNSIKILKSRDPLTCWRPFASLLTYAYTSNNV